MQHNNAVTACDKLKTILFGISLVVLLCSNDVSACKFWLSASLCIDSLSVDAI